MSEPVTCEGTEIVGRYALHGEIASGGMAVVYFGKLLGPVGFTRPVAIKRVHPQLARDLNVRDMFIDEARLASRIRHSNVVPTLDVVTDGNELLLVMEYVHGESLQHLLRASRQRGERVPLRLVLAVITGVLHGLHAAHEAKTEAGEPLNIVHRDVSPQNVICGVDGVPRVLDFGIARAAVRLENTREGLVKGKLAYMAPEQMGGATVDRRADIYSAGVLLWEMLTGHRLFVREESASVMVDKLLRGTIEPPSKVAPEVPRLLDAITLHALARDPERRFATAREMALALERFGETARPSELGEWVESLAAESLAQRRGRLQELEMTSSTYKRAPASDGRVASPSHSSLREALPIEEEVTGAFPGEGGGPAAPDGHAVSSLPSPHSVSLSPAHGSLSAAVVQAAADGRLRLRLLLGGAALLGGAIVFAAVNLPRSHRSEDGGAAARNMPAGAAAAALVPPAPTCPSGTVKIPGGKFFMGSDEGLPMERPSHNVTLSPFCIDVHETTTEDYKACSDNGECKRAGITNDWDGISDTEHKTFDPLCNVRDPDGRGKHPINCVDWEMATIFCKAHSKRLPTEAEWEFAARGPDGRKYPWGDEEPGPTLLNACGKECVDWGRKNRIETKAMFSADDGWATTAPVGSFPKGASRYGLQDVVGNVWEWVADYYAEYSKGDAVDPSGPATGDERVIRGGSWNGAYAAWVRPTFRYKDIASKRSYGIGFRCASSL